MIQTRVLYCGTLTILQVMVWGVRVGGKVSYSKKVPTFYVQQLVMPSCCHDHWTSSTKLLLLLYARFGSNYTENRCLVICMGLWKLIIHISVSCFLSSSSISQLYSFGIKKPSGLTVSTSGFNLGVNYFPSRRRGPKSFELDTHKPTLPNCRVFHLF